MQKIRTTESGWRGVSLRADFATKFNKSSAEKSRLPHFRVLAHIRSQQHTRVQVVMKRNKKGCNGSVAQSPSSMTRVTHFVRPPLRVVSVSVCASDEYHRYESAQRLGIAAHVKAFRGFGDQKGRESMIS